MRARLVSDDGTRIRLELESGEPAVIRRAGLSDADIAYLNQLRHLRPQPGTPGGTADYPIMWGFPNDFPHPLSKNSMKPI